MESLFPGKRIELSFPAAQVQRGDGFAIVAGYEDTVPTGQENLHELSPLFVAVDSCGVLRKLDEAGIVHSSNELLALRPTVGVGRFEATNESPRTIEFQPKQTVEVGDGTFIYLSREEETLTVIGVDSTWKLDPLGDAMFENQPGRFEVLGMAAAEGGILVLNIRQIVDANRFAWAAFLDLSDGILQQTVELGGYEYVFDVSAAAQPPLVGNDGRVIVEQSGVVWGIRTNLSGLARTKFPRGIAFGGNGNTPQLP